jgi:hypothetical protein
MLIFESWKTRVHICKGLKRDILYCVDLGVTRVRVSIRKAFPSSMHCTYTMMEVLWLTVVGDFQLVALCFLHIWSKNRQSRLTVSRVLQSMMSLGLESTDGISLNDMSFSFRSYRRHSSETCSFQKYVSYAYIHVYNMGCCSSS